MRCTTPEDGTVRDLQMPERVAQEIGDEPDAAGPEDDGVIEIDIIYGRVSVDLESLPEDLYWEGPELDSFDLTHPPLELDLTLEDALGPELDLEHVPGEGRS